jgi:hypothetical protein
MLTLVSPTMARTCGLDLGRTLGLAKGMFRGQRPSNIVDGCSVRLRGTGDEPASQHCQPWINPPPWR